MSTTESDRLLIGRVRRGESEAWEELIARYEGRLRAFLGKRLNRPSQVDDVVQETFIGFLNSLPNYDDSRPLESYLFSIAAYKLTDHLRHEGRRPTVPLVPDRSKSDGWDVAGPGRKASSLFRSKEQRNLEETALLAAISDQIEHLQEKGDWEKLKCMELLFVRGWANKDAAEQLGVSEQKVANYKYDFVAKLKKIAGRQGVTDIPGLEAD